MCVCVCFSSLFYLHNLALDFIIFAIFSGIFERSFSSGSGTFEYANGLGGNPPCAEYNQLQKSTAEQKKVANEKKRS